MRPCAYTSPALLCLVVHVAAIGRRPRFEPLPMCPDCVPREDILAPGIGFDLTTSYATAAIRNYDGSIDKLVKVNGGDDYKQLMARVSDPSSETRCAEGYWNEIQCRVARAKRQWNKLLGRPSTTEVGTIADLVLKLRVALETQIGPERTKGVILTAPTLPGLSYEDLQDAIEYNGLTMLSTHKHIGDKISEVSAAFAGLGYGLCEHYNDADVCENEEADLPVSHILAVSLSQTSFSAAYTYMHTAYRSILEKESTRFDLGLRGHSSNGKDSAEEKELYWSSIRATIVEVGRASRARLTTLVLLGENAGDPDFIRNVQDALQELLPGASPQEVSTLLSSGKRNDELEPLYLAARGAAEFAKRAQEAPAGCREPARCAENRIPPVDLPSNQVLLSKERQRVEIEL